MDKFVVLNINAAHGLAKKDLVGTSDPFCVVFVNSREVGRTTVIKKVCSPLYPDRITPRTSPCIIFVPAPARAVRRTLVVHTVPAILRQSV